MLGMNGTVSTVKYCNNSTSAIVLSASPLERHDINIQLILFQNANLRYDLFAKN